MSAISLNSFAQLLRYRESRGGSKGEDKEPFADPLLEAMEWDLMFAAVVHNDIDPMEAELLRSFRSELLDTAPELDRIQYSPPGSMSGGSLERLDWPPALVPLDPHPAIPISSAKSGKRGTWDVQQQRIRSIWLSAMRRGTVPVPPSPPIEPSSIEETFPGLRGKRTVTHTKHGPILRIEGEEEPVLSQFDVKAAIHKHYLSKLNFLRHHAGNSRPKKKTDKGDAGVHFLEPLGEESVALLEFLELENKRICPIRIDKQADSGRLSYEIDLPFVLISYLSRFAHLLDLAPLFLESSVDPLFQLRCERMYLLFSWLALAKASPVQKHGSATKALTWSALLNSSSRYTRDERALLVFWLFCTELLPTCRKSLSAYEDDLSIGDLATGIPVDPDAREIFVHHHFATKLRRRRVKHLFCLVNTLIDDIQVVASLARKSEKHVHKTPSVRD